MNTHFLTASDMSVKKPGSAWPGRHLAGAAGEVQEVDVFSFEEFGCCACVFDGAAAFFVVAASQAYGDDEVLIGFGFDASDDFEGKAEAVGGGLRSVFVVSVVGDRRVELVQEVSVCAVDFYAVIAGFLDAEGCCNVFLFQVVDFIDGEGSCLVSGPFDVRRRRRDPCLCRVCVYWRLRD